MRWLPICLCSALAVSCSVTVGCSLVKAKVTEKAKAAVDEKAGEAVQAQLEKRIAELQGTNDQLASDLARFKADLEREASERAAGGESTPWLSTLKANWLEVGLAVALGGGGLGAARQLRQKKYGKGLLAIASAAIAKLPKEQRDAVGESLDKEIAKAGLTGSFKKLMGDLGVAAAPDA